jgi:hypothetical protein
VGISRWRKEEKAIGLKALGLLNDLHYFFLELEEGGTFDYDERTYGYFANPLEKLEAAFKGHRELTVLRSFLNSFKRKGAIDYADRATERAGVALGHLYDFALNQLPVKERERWTVKKIGDMVKYEDAEPIEKK